MKKFSHLSVYAHQQAEVAVSGSSVGTIYGLLVALECLRSLTLVAIGAAKEIMGTGALVGSTVAVVVVGGLGKDTVRGCQGDIAAVHGIGLGKNQFHAHLLAACTGSEK